jgi:hypothetical protein
MTKKTIKNIRTENLKADFEAYKKVNRYNYSKGVMTWEQWAKWVWKRRTNENRSVFKGMKFVDFVAL